MTTFTSFFKHALLALTLAVTSNAVLAVPTRYHVELDTGMLSGNGYLDLQFQGLGDAGAATAVISQFFGNAIGASESDGTVTGNFGTFATITASPYNYLDQLVAFGGKFGFNLMLDLAASGGQSTFSVALYDLDLNYVGVNGPVATFELIPGEGVLVAHEAAFASITDIAAEVPEPGQWLLMATGLLLLGAMTRRRSL